MLMIRALRQENSATMTVDSSTGNRRASVTQASSCRMAHVQVQYISFMFFLQISISCFYISLSVCLQILMNAPFIPSSVRTVV